MGTINEPAVIQPYNSSVVPNYGNQTCTHLRPCSKVVLPLCLHHERNLHFLLQFDMRALTHRAITVQPREETGWLNGNFLGDVDGVHCVELVERVVLDCGQVDAVVSNGYVGLPQIFRCLRVQLKVIPEEPAVVEGHAMIL
jgi:hypothetical protein